MTQKDPDFPVSIRRTFRRAGFAVLGTVTAVVLWAGFAPITSTLQIPGSVTTVQPVVDLQHLEGGRIAEVLVRRLDAVAKGQLVLRFDVGAAVETRLSVTRQIAMLETELRITEPDSPPVSLASAASDDLSAVLVEVGNLRQRHVADSIRLLAELDASQARGTALGREIETQTKLASIATARAKRLRSLVDQALRPDNDLAVAEEQLVTATLALQERQSERQNADKQAAITGREIAAQEADFAVTLASIRRKDTERLIELRHKLTELDSVIAHAEIRAPVAATVAALPFDTAGDIAHAGEVLAQISAPVEGVEIKLRVPIRYIDQVTPGERGTILIPALPQRQMPRVGMTVIAVGSSAELDRDGNPTSYAALALIDPEDVAPILHALGPGYRIVRDMPVVVMLDGRATTPLGYFLDPLRAAAQLAFEEG